MKPRGIGRGRIVIACGALVTAIGCFLPWWSVGGTVTALHTGNAFSSVFGTIVFAAALLMLATVVLPYASRDRESSLDRPAVYLLLLVIAVASFSWRLYQIAAPDFAGLAGPREIPGAWISGAGLIVAALGLIELFGERRAEG